MRATYDAEAFGRPGIEPRWTHGGKDGVGTAYAASSLIWFTLWNVFAGRLRIFGEVGKIVEMEKATHATPLAPKRVQRRIDTPCPKCKAPTWWATHPQIMEKVRIQGRVHYKLQCQECGHQWEWKRPPRSPIFRPQLEVHDEAVESALKLVPEPGPPECSRITANRLLKRRAWNAIKRDSRIAAGNKCSICSATGPKLLCHEIWEYNSGKHIATLAGFRTICARCSGIIHVDNIAMTIDRGRPREHMCRVNGIGQRQAEEILRCALDVWRPWGENGQWEIRVRSDLLARYPKLASLESFVGIAAAVFEAEKGFGFTYRLERVRHWEIVDVHTQAEAEALLIGHLRALLPGRSVIIDRRPVHLQTTERLNYSARSE